MYTVEEFDREKTKVLKYILYKKRTEQEVRRKFSSTINEDMLEDIIEYLKEAKYIDDNEFISKTINNYIALKNSSIKELEYKLLSKGLDKKDIDNYIYEIKSAKNIFYKKSTSMEEQEIVQYLLKKGYKMENIKEAIEQTEG